VASSFQIVFQYPELVMPQETGSMPVLETGTMPILKVTAFYVAMFMALFTIAFGTRHLDVSERHEGMVAAIAFESLVKLVAFLAVGVYVTSSSSMASATSSREPRRAATSRTCSPRSTSPARSRTGRG
jgi:Na+/proline symporter